jgi:hypothetical protein
MRKLIYSILTFFMVLLAGCFETTQELTLNEDGSGVLTTTNDMSNVFSMLGQMGGAADKMEKIKDVDSVISFATLVDSIPDLSPEEKKLISKGTMKIVLKQKDEKLYTTLSFPFQKISELKIIQGALPKVGEQASKKLMGDKMEMPIGMDESDVPKPKSFDDYYDLAITNNSITKSINKEKYPGAAEDQYMKLLQQMSSMGAPATAKYVINLPRPATKVEGKGVKLSDDKKTATLTVNSDDFFDEPKKLEFKIEF